MKGLLPLALLTVVAASASAQTGRFSATYVGKYPAKQPLRITFRTDGTCVWQSATVKGNGAYTRRGNKLTLVVLRRNGIRPMHRAESSGSATLLNGGQILTLHGPDGRQIDTLRKVEKKVKRSPKLGE